MPGFVPRDLRKFVNHLQVRSMDGNVNWKDIEHALKNIQPSQKNNFESRFIHEQGKTELKEIESVAGCHEVKESITMLIKLPLQFPDKFLKFNVSIILNLLHFKMIDFYFLLSY